MKNCKYITTLLLLLTAFVINLDAQISSDELSVVYTKNGSIIKGNIIAYEQGKQLQLQLINGTVITLNDKKIKKIYSAENLESNTVNEKLTDILYQFKKEYVFTERGYYFLSSVPLALGYQSWNNVPHLGFGIHQSAGYQFNRLLGAGVGIGFDAYYPRAGQQFVPVYAEARGYFLKEWVSPTYSFAAGYGFIPNSNSANIDLVDKKGGFYAHPSLGFRFGASKNANFTLDFGVKFQQGSFVYNEWGNVTTQKTKFQRFTVRSGLLF